MRGYLSRSDYPSEEDLYGTSSCHAAENRPAAVALTDSELEGTWIGLAANPDYPDEASVYPSAVERSSCARSFTYLRSSEAYPAGDLSLRSPESVRAVPSDPLSGAVSIIVAARNNAAYLGDALRSALAQSVSCEVLYIDDGSEDGSLRIAADYPGVRTIRQSHQGVCAARNRGVAESKGEYLLFLDGDDQLPYQYVEAELRAMEPGISFCYSPAQAFGLLNLFWDVLDWDGRNIWARNYVNTSTLHRRSDLLAVGGWQEGIGSAWDWHLALRYARAGYRGKPVRDNFLMYRQHDASISRTTGEKGDEQTVRRIFWLMRHAVSRPRIGLVLSDRVFDLFAREWLPAVRRNLRYYAARMRAESPCGPFGVIQPSLPALEVVYTGDRRLIDVHRAIDPFADEFADIQVTRMPFRASAPLNGKAEALRRDRVAAFLAGAYNRLLDQPGEVIWFLEDDVVPPDRAYFELICGLLGADSMNARFAVSGCYRNRHVPEVYLLSDWPSDNPDDLRHCAELPRERFYVDLAGTGCLAVFRPFAPHRFTSHVAQVAAHDWAWCRGLGQYTDHFHPRERRVLALPSVACRHYQDAARFLG